MLRGRACHGYSLLVLALALPALLLSTSLCNRDTQLDSDLMVVRFVCLACEGLCPGQAPTYFTSYKAATTHVARSPRCRIQNKIATVVLPNRPADNEAGGSGAAGPWTGQSQNQRRRSDLARPCPSGSGARAGIPVYWYIPHDIGYFILKSLLTAFAEQLTTFAEQLIS